MVFNFDVNYDGEHTSHILIDYSASQMVILFGESNLQCEMTKYDPKEIEKL